MHSPEPRSCIESWVAARQEQRMRSEMQARQSRGWHGFCGPACRVVIVFSHESVAICRLLTAGCI